MSPAESWVFPLGGVILVWISLLSKPLPKPVHDMDFDPQIEAVMRVFWGVIFTIVIWLTFIVYRFCAG